MDFKKIIDVIVVIDVIVRYYMERKSSFNFNIR